MRIEAIHAGIRAISNAYLPDRRINNNNISLVNTGVSLVSLRNQQVREISDVVSFSGLSKK